MSLPAMTLEDKFCVRRNGGTGGGGTGGGGWGHPKGANSMARSGFDCRKALAGPGGPFLSFLAQMDLEETSHLTL